MVYVSIDTETTGLDSENCQIMSFAAVIEDTLQPNIPVKSLPSMHVIVKRKTLNGEPYAMNMNADLIKIIAEGKDERLIEESELGLAFRKFLMNNNLSPKKIQVAGKNFSGFDKKFLDKVLFLPTDGLTFSHRVLDVGSVFVDFKTDFWIPDLNECMHRAGIEGTVTHDALEDARDVIRTLRKKY